MLGTVISDFDKIANELANEFVFENSESIDEDVLTEINDYEQNYTTNHPDYSIPEITHVEIQKAIGKVKKCKPLSNTVPKRMFKMFTDAICIPLCILFNFIFVQNIVPDAMKIATCTPLYKGKGRFSSSASYRAIFHHSFVTKIFEKILFYRLTAMVSDKLNNAQHGFRPGRSCNTAVTFFTQKIHDFLDLRNGKAIAVFIDFRKAFDTVNRKILLKKLMTEFDLAPYMVKVLASYFTNRKFKIIMDENESKFYNIENGVPPGAGPSALLFSLFINNISSITDLDLDLDMLLYADDAVIFTKCENYNEGIVRINDCMLNLEKWCEENDIKINVEKTKFMCFYKGNDYRSKRQLEGLSENVCINGEKVERVHTFKYLGVHIDSALTFKTHFSHVEKRMNASLGRLYAYKRCIPKTRLKIFLTAFVTSIFEYCCTVWAIQSETELGKLQNRINRFIYTIEYTHKRNRNVKISLSKMNKILIEMNLLTIMELRKLSLIKFVYKLEKNKMFENWFERTKLSTRDKPRLKVPVCKTEKLKNSVRWSSTVLCNEIVNENIKLFDDEDGEFHYVDKVKEYLFKFRSKIYI